jgi:hypothetical protein
MKKTILISIALFMVAAISVKAANPIPSYNVPVNSRTVFLEDRSTLCVVNNGEEKRDMNIQNSGGGYAPEVSYISVIVYRLDNQKTKGPYIIMSGEHLSVPIDGKEWGVIMDPSSTSTVSVWIDK